MMLLQMGAFTDECCYRWVLLQISVAFTDGYLYKWVCLQMVPVSGAVTDECFLQMSVFYRWVPLQMEAFTDGASVQHFRTGPLHMAWG